VLDFGIAKLVRLTPGTERTQTGNMLGTPRYIAPEQARGVNVDPRADIYSLGVMAFEMLAGRPPFEGETAMDLVVKHLNEPAPKLSELVRVPKTLEACVMSMLEKSPDDRPTLARVRAVLADPTGRATPVPVAPPRRWPIWIAALIGAVVLGGVTWKVVGGGGGAADSGSPTPTPTPAPVTPPVTVEHTVTKPPKGNVEIDVSGAKDAVILIDGVEVGHGAQLKAELDPGPHDIEVRAAGHGQMPLQHVDLAANETNTLSFSFSAAAAPPVSHPPATHTQHGSKDPKPKPDDDDLLTPHKGH
jgi:eukaryotic-like serine/threonine-protein kinase